MSVFLRVKNWDKFQHYKKRDEHWKPPWIKLHRDILTSPAWVLGDAKVKALLITLLLLASRHDNLIPYDLTYIRDSGQLRDNQDEQLKFLITKGFCEILDSRKILEHSSRKSLGHSRKIPHRIEKSRIEKKPQPPAHLGVSGGWETFWQAYPKKLGKQEAFRAWKKLSPNNGQVKAILEGLALWERSHQWKRERPRFIPYPATFLNQRRWEETPTELIKQERPKDPENCLKCGAKIETLGASVCRACAIALTTSPAQS